LKERGTGTRLYPFPLAPRTALLSAEVVLVQLDEPLPGELPQPGKKRQRPALHEVGELLGGVHPCLL
jgi:hypothetical protein